MTLDLREIIGVPGLKAQFEYAPDLSDFLGGSLIQVLGAARAAGSVRNDAGALSLQASVEAQLRAVCGRCLGEFTFPLHREIRVSLTESESAEEDSELHYVGDGKVDLDMILVTELTLQAEQNPLCREDCRGLCQTCGADLNQGDCACEKETDPRFAVLRQLLDEK